jgi:5-methylthioribose kinase
LTVASAPLWLEENGFNPLQVEVTCIPLTGGVSATVIAATGKDIAVVVKQPHGVLAVADHWEADVNRSVSEAEALTYLNKLTPGEVPRLLHHDLANHILALELLPTNTRNWQDEIALSNVHPYLGRWAGALLARWHLGTVKTSVLTCPGEAFERFEQLRLRPFYEKVMSRVSEVSASMQRCADDLRGTRICLVSGDFAPKNIMVTPSGKAWALDLEVAHVGNPVFDQAFFLSFVVLSALRWPDLGSRLETLGDQFIAAYNAVAPRLLADQTSLIRHVGCLMLARTDGASPATFLNAGSRDDARIAAVAMLQEPEQGMWSWMR